MAFTKKTWVNKGETGATPLNATNLNDLENRIDNALTPEKLTASDFFKSLNVTIVDFYVYKYGDIINIQRISHSRVTGVTSVTIGVVKDKYLPISGVPVRLEYQNDYSEMQPSRVLLQANGELQYTSATQINSGGYVYNASYICKG